MPAWIIAVICLIAALAISRWVVKRYQRSVNRTIAANRSRAIPTPIPSPDRRSKLYD